MLNYKKIIEDIDSKKKATNRAMGDLLGITESTFRSRRDSKNFTPDDIEKIADYFGRTIAYYFDRDEPQPYTHAEKLNVVEDGCPMCEVYKERIVDLKAQVASKDQTIASKDQTIESKDQTIESQKETIAALKGDDKKEMPLTGS